METKVFLNLVKFKICNFTTFYKNKCTQKETKRKNFEKNHIFQDKKYTENVNYTRVRMDTMLTPSKIGTKIRCIITCCVRGNVDEDVDDGCKSDDDDE